MNTRALLGLSSALLVTLALAGCSITTEVVEVTATPGTTVSEGGVTITQSDDDDDDDVESDDELFLSMLEGTLRVTSLNGEELVAAGQNACGGLSAGVDLDNLRPVGGEGEDADFDNARIIQYAVEVFCPEYEDLLP